MNENVLFHTEVVNEEGLRGTAYVKSGGLKVETSSPLSDEPGTNPEELIGLSWATCLNATIEVLLNGRGLEGIRSKVEVHIDYKKEPGGIGYFFDLTAFVSIEDVSLELAEKLAAAAHKRCPVSKILANYEHARIKVVPFA